MNNTLSTLPVAIIGAGPVGLAAAAHLLERGIQPLLLEAGPKVAEHFRQYGHVRLFSPWRYNIDKAASRLLRSHGWIEPDPENCRPLAISSNNTWNRSPGCRRSHLVYDSARRSY